MGFAGSSAVNNMPANTGTQVQSLGCKNSLRKEMATHSSILAWKIPQSEEPDHLWGPKRVGHDSVTEKQPEHPCYNLILEKLFSPSFLATYVSLVDSNQVKKASSLPDCSPGC